MATILPSCYYRNIAQAKAEERRAMAVATEQEMKAKAEEARANVIQEEAEVPKAMAEAFRSGNLGIMDYYKMKNIPALHANGIPNRLR